MDDFIKYYFAYISQVPELMMNWTVFENILLPLIGKGKNIMNKTKVKEYCDMVDILLYENCRLSTLSIGTRRLVDVARAVAKEPKILIADEPTEGLDTKTRDKITKFLIKQQNNGILVVATHLQSTKNMFNKQYIIKNKTLIREV